jgi:hypothetical protein
MFSESPINKFKKEEANMTYRINDGDVPRQRPSTPEEETIDLAVERMAPA